MNAISIFIAPASQRPLLSALMDLSSVGLLQPFGWMEAPEDPQAAPDAFDPRLLWVKSGLLSVKTVSQISHRDDIARIRKFLLVPAETGGRSALSRDAEEFYLQRAFPNAVKQQNVRIIVPGVKEGEVETLGRQGWHNLMLSPEISSDPNFPGVPWWGSPELIPGAAAAQLAVLAGIAGDVWQTPLDGDSDFSDTVRVVRVFSRMANGKGVEETLRSDVLHLGNHFPAPHRVGVGSALQPFPEPKVACKQTADKWAEVYEKTIRPSHKELPPYKPEQLGLFKALRWFFSFLWGSLLGAPRDWLTGKLRQVRSSIANSASALIFGDRSAYEVIVEGVDRRGDPAGWSEVSTSVTKVNAALSGDPTAEGTANSRDLSSLWENLRAGGVSLLDGSSCSALSIGGGNNYVPDRRDVVSPLNDGGSFTIARGVQSLFRDPVIPAWDELAIADAQKILKEAAKEDGNVGAAAGPELERLRNWNASNSDRYLPRIGRSLAGWFQAVHQDIKKYLAEIESLTDRRVDDQLQREQSRLGKALRVISIVSLVVVLLFVVLGVFDVLAWAIAGIIIGFALVAWLLGYIVIFIRLRIKVFNILHQREQSQARLANLNQYLHLSLENLSAIGTAYRQYRLWASIFTAFITDPLGKDVEPSHEEVRDFQTPASMQVRDATSDPRHVEDAGATLRAGSFTEGWLHEAWDAFVEETPKYLTSDYRHRWKHEGFSMESDSGKPGSALYEWTEGIAKDGVVSKRADQIWETCLEQLPYGASEELSLKVQTSEGEKTVKDWEKRLSQPPLRHVVSQVIKFDRRAEGHGEIVANWHEKAEDGLSSTVVLVQLTAPIDPDVFVYAFPD